MQGILYEEQSIWLFALVTVCMGGWAAWMTGRAVAITWRPVWQYVAAAFVLAGVVRFFHFALFDGTLRSLHYYLVCGLLLEKKKLIGYSYSRANQMTTQYRWLYERAGPLTCREKPPSEPP